MHSVPEFPQFAVYAAECRKVSIRRGALHMNAMGACDLLWKTLWTPLGKNTAYALAFIHLGSRKVFGLVQHVDAG